MKIHLLLTDDDDSTRELLAALLSQEFRGMLSITKAHSGNEAIRLLLEGHKFDLIVSDYSMNDGDGADLLRFVHENYPSMPFILFTSMEMPSLPEVDGNFVGIVEKPDFSRLKMKIVEAICADLTADKRELVSK